VCACAAASAAFQVSRKLQKPRPPLDYQTLIWMQKMAELLLRVATDWLLAGSCCLLAAAAVAAEVCKD